MRVITSLIVTCLCFSFGPAGFTATKPETLTVGYSTFAGAYAPLWMAVEEQLGVKYGLDLKAIYAGRIRPQQLLATGDVPFVLATGTGAITSHILGVKDQVLVAVTTTKTGTSLFAKSEIKSVEDLKGKTIATGRPGAFLDATVRYVLRSKFGLIPDRDVKLLPSGEPVLSIQALEGGLVDAAAMSMPFVFFARKAGLRELVTFDKIGIEYPYTSVTVMRQTLSKSPELVEKFLKCIIEGIYLFKTHPSRATAVLKRYQKGASDEIVEQTYQYTKGVLDDVPQARVQVIKVALEMLSAQYPQAKQTDANLIVDPSFINKIEQSGFIRALYKK